MVGARQHKLILQNRGVGDIIGICDVVSFDENAVVLNTGMGLSIIKGKGLHVSRLILEKGEMDIEGTVDNMIYGSNEALHKSGEPLFTRLFKQKVSSASNRVQYEIWLMVLSLVAGAWLMLVYDALRVFRLVIHHDPIWARIEDFLYWLYAGPVTFILLYEQNDGVFRAYVIGEVFIEMILYDRFISRIFFKCLKKISRYLKMIINRNKPGEVCNREQSKVGD